VLHQFLFTEVKHICPQPVTGLVSRLVFTGSIPVLHTNSANRCVLSTRQERRFNWIDTSEWWWREERWTSRDSPWLPDIGTWRYPIQAYKWVWVWHPGLIPVNQKNSCTHFSQAHEALRQLDLVNPLLSMNEAWMDECAARLQPLVDQYKSRQNQIFIIEKFRDLIVTTRFCPEPAI